MAAAFGAAAIQHQHAGLYLAGQVAYGRHFSAVTTPDIIQEPNADVAGYGFPDFFRFRRK